MKDADGIRNLASIVGSEMPEQIVMVVSAMGKTTNAFEKVVNLRFQLSDWHMECESIKAYHLNICAELGLDMLVFRPKLEKIFEEINTILSIDALESYDYIYDQVVSFGEIISTTIVHEFLVSTEISSRWLDARELIITDNSFRSARVDLEATEKTLQKSIPADLKVNVIQGFIGRDPEGNTTTLGREGSDYTAAILAYAFRVPEVTIWKDVDGVYSADPKVFSGARLIPLLSYKEAVELAFYGASIIHPKTIQPLQTRKINLRVRSFYNTTHAGSLVSDFVSSRKPVSSIILKRNQVLISLIPRDFSFMDVANMGLVFQILARHQHPINLIQNSAISFSLCMDYNHAHFSELILELSGHFETKYNLNQVLITIRHYPTGLIDKIYDKLDFKMEQRNRSTYQVVMGEDDFSAKFLPLID